MPGPLTGVRVLEFAGLGPTPFCGMLLGDMGAEILRVDRVTEGEDGGIPLPPKFDLRNRNKRSAAINLKHPEGAAAALRLIERADILLEGFRPGVAERLGVGPDQCLARRPALIYCRATGWGQTGPLSGMAGHDINYIALTGALDMIGPPGGAPSPPLNLLGDYAGGAYLAFGAVCALLEARASGVGQVIDFAMIDAVTSMLAVAHAMRQTGQLAAGRGANILDGGAPYYTTYETKDGGYMAVGAIEPHFYAAMVRGLGLDPHRMPPQHDRSAWPESRARIAAAFRTATREEWSRKFETLDACVTPVLGLTEAADHSQNRARASLIDVEGAEHPHPAPRLSRTPAEISSRAPFRGEHTAAALAEWGFGREEISAGIGAGYFASGAHQSRERS